MKRNHFDNCKSLGVERKYTEQTKEKMRESWIVRREESK
jgi:hypothetical protein